MNVTSLQIADVLLIQPKRWHDSRGWFEECFELEKYRAATGRVNLQFVQSNHSFSHQHVLRGLHFQRQKPQGKLVSCLSGEIWDVALDMRAFSPTFGQWVGVFLSGQNGAQLWIPEGFAHGFCVTSSAAHVVYHCTTLYEAQQQGTIKWNDSDLNIAWPCTKPLLSLKDSVASAWCDVQQDCLQVAYNTR